MVHAFDFIYLHYMNSDGTDIQIGNLSELLLLHHLLLLGHKRPWWSFQSTKHYRAYCKHARSSDCVCDIATSPPVQRTE